MCSSGMEVVGIVQKVWANVENLKLGNRVYGDNSKLGFGSFD